MDERKLKYPGSLHNHLDWSNERLRDCIIKTEDLIDYAIELGHQVVAITDHETVSGAVRAEKYYRKIKEKNPDFKLILGNEIYLCRNGLNASNYKAGQDKYYHFILLAKDAIGHQQIRELSTRAWLRSYMARGMRRVPTYYSDLFEIIGANPGHVIGSTACFRAGTQVETKLGWKNIEEIQPGDFIINRYGEWEEVIEPTSRNYSGNGYEIILGGNPTPIYCTSNHQFLVISNNKKTPRWVSAEELITKKGGTKHICLLPCSYEYKSNSYIEKSEFLHSWSSQEQSYKKYILPNQIKITPELMRLFGLFLGDGCITLKKNPNINFTFNEKEFPIYYNSFILPASQQLGIEWSVSTRPDNHRVDISCASRELIDLFYYLFGNVKADTKKIPERLRISEELDYELVFGYFLADGYFRTRKPSELVKYICGEFVSASISKQLSYDIYKILNQLHITSGISLAKERIGKDGVHHQNAWYVEGSNNILGAVKKLQPYSHQEVCQIFSQAKAIKQGDYIFIDGTWYRKVRIKSKTKITMNETVYCLNDTTHSFKCENIIVHNCLGGCLPTQLLRAKTEPELLPKIYNWISQLDNLFGHGNFFFEMQPSHNKDQVYVNQRLFELSEELDIPYIITTDSHYLKKEDRTIHKAYLNAQNGDREVDDFYASTYMMNTEELESYFGYFSREQLEKAYRNILKIRETCEDYSLLKPLRIPELEWYKYPQNKDEYLFYKNKIPLLETFYNSNYIGDRHLVWAVIDGIKSRRGLQTDEAYKEINVCLDDTWRSSIKNNAHWSAYYLNLQKNIDLCWEAGSLVGPGRGSGAGFILLYVLGITQINPLLEETKVFHWRFLNPDRASVLDCDTDIEGSKRAQVLQKFRDFYGEDRVSNVATFKTEKSKSAILTACRGLNIEVDIASYLAGLIPSDRGQLRSLSQCMNGDEEKDFKPIKQFVFEMTENYPEVWAVASKIEGLICGVGIHAGGVIFVDEPFTNSTALMRAPDGTIITAFELHDCEDVSLIKIDMLSIEALDKIHNELDLLVEYGYIKPEATLRETYEKIIGIYNLERTAPEMWQMVWEHKITSLFQMEKQSGINGIALTHPKSVSELAVLNSVIRLMAPEKGAEQPLDMWARYRSNIIEWEREMHAYGLSQNNIDWLMSHNAITDGICESQEGMMQLLQEEQLGGNSLTFADKCRKAIAKKQGKLFDECEKAYFENAQEKNCDMKLVHYVWDILLRVQRGYSFCRAHTLSYSLVALQEMNLAYRFPIIFWNCACLISDSGGNEQQGDDDDENEEEDTFTIEKYTDCVEEFDDDDEEDEEDDAEVNKVLISKKKKKVKVSNYGKIAAALGKMQTAGISVAPPDINKSTFTFSPDVENSIIRFGMNGITKVGQDIVKQIIENRPYTSILDFLSKVKINKPQMVNLIKCGAFDSFGPREQVMREYVNLISDAKKRITLQNMKMLIDFGLIPNEYDFICRVFNFNKYLKTFKVDDLFLLDNIAMAFFDKNFSIDKLAEDTRAESGFGIKQVAWKKIYDGVMDRIRPYVKENNQKLLDAVNTRLTEDVWNKYCLGNISKWEMDSVSCYFHEHELARVNNVYYGFSNFFDLPEEPEIERVFEIKGKRVPIFKIHRIYGTVLDRDKMKKLVTLLTPDGVVTVKIFGEVFNIYDRQISEKGADGKKHVKEKSTFARGNKIVVCGIRDGDSFRAKKYKATPYHLCELIEEVYSDGKIKMRPRLELDE